MLVALAVVTSLLYSPPLNQAGARSLESQGSGIPASARAGDTVVVVGRVSIGTGMRASRRPGFHLAGPTSGVEVRMRDVVVLTAVGDSVAVRGVVDTLRGRARLNALEIVRFDVPRREPVAEPVHLFATTRAWAASVGRLVTFQADVAMKRQASYETIVLLADPDSAAPLISVSAQEGHALSRLRSLRPGDRVQMTGVIGGGMSRERGPEFEVYIRGGNDIHLVGWTRTHTNRMTVLGAILLVSALGTVAFRRRRDVLEFARQRDAAARHKALYARANDAILLVDLTTLLPIEVNSAAEQLLGAPGESLRAVPVVDHFVTEDHAAIGTALSGLQSVGIWEGAACVTKDGARYEVAVRVHVIDAKQGNQAVMVIRDVSAQTALAEQLRQAQKMEAVGQLAGGVAHDFNNLLTVIMASAESADETVAADSPAREDIQQIRLAAENAANLTRQLLAYSRKQLIRPQQFELDAMITAVMPMLRRLVGEDIRLTMNLAAGRSLVLADRGQMEQVIVNLVVNARDAMPAGGTISVRSARGGTADTCPGTTGNCVRLDVEDEGTGIDPEVLPRVFEPFFTTKELGRGTGLGLATVHGIVKQAGGSIRAMNNAGRGTTMHITLPLHGVAEDKVAAAANAPLRKSAGTVLIVEDDELVRTATCRLLRDSGFEALPAASPTAAIEIASQGDRSIDLLLTDMVMPEMGGTTLSHRIEALRPDIATVYMSGYTDDEIVRRGVSQDRLTFLEKPFTRAQLIAALESHSPRIESRASSVK